MQRVEYDGLSAALAAWAAEAEGVLGLVMVGSSAETSHAPDAWSDHDFFVIAEPEWAERLRASAAWLPVRAEGIVLHERDTAHGAWVVYGDGHMLEYAVFAPDEIAESRSGAARVVVDRVGDLEARMEPTIAAPPWDPRPLATALHRSLLVGSGRAARGERLAARRRLLDAVGSLLELVDEVVPAERPVGDPHDPWRRVELTHPAIARRLDAILERGDPRAALEVARLAADVAGTEPWWPSSLAAAVCERIAADADAVPSSSAGSGQPPWVGDA